MAGTVVKLDNDTFEMILAIQEQIKQQTGFRVAYSQICRKMFVEGNPEKIFGIKLTADIPPEQTHTDQ